MRKFSFLLFAVLVLSTASAWILDCTFSEVDNWMIGEMYTCVGRVIKIGEPRIITEVSQNHQPGRNNSDVKGLRINAIVIGFLPRNLGSFFPNLEGYQFIGTGITEMTREDFQDLPNLRMIYTASNLYQEIGNIFENNPKLQILNFGMNPLKSVSSRAFSNLTKLTMLHIGETACISQWVNNRNAVLNLISNLFRSCPPSPQMNQVEMLESEDFIRAVDQRS
jgi:hypothetical protein